MADQGSVWVVDYDGDIMVGGWQMMNDLLNEALAQAGTVEGYIEEAQEARRLFEAGARYVHIEEVWSAKYVKVRD